MSTPYINASHAPTTPIVQGQIVEARTGVFHLEGDVPKGEPQPSQYQDTIWGIFFYLHLVAISVCTIIFVPQVAQEIGGDYVNGAQRMLDEAGGAEGNEEMTLDMSAVLLIVAFSGLTGCILSSLAMIFMMSFAEVLIKMALLWNVVVAIVMIILAIAGGVAQMAVMFGIVGLISAYWCYIVWHKIPFAASNLITATTVVRNNIGLAFFAYTNLFLTFLWSFWWASAFVSTSYVLGDCAADGTCQQDINGGVVFLFLVSFFWTTQVLKNVTHTTVAGTVGTFWFAPLEANGCCSRAVRDSYIRSMTTSFGSICLGSLIVAIIQAIKEIVTTMRQQDDSFLVCIAECILGLIESLMEYFNQWAFVYVGLYGYSLIDAGRNVMQLFRSRGWTSIIADMLVDTVLLMVSLGVGVLTGLVGVLIGSMVQQDANTLAAGFLVGMLIGFVLSSTIFSLISSAVNATVVLYAEAPSEFQANHPRLSDQMRESWKAAYPDEFHY